MMASRIIAACAVALATIACGEQSEPAVETGGTGGQGGAGGGGGMGAQVGAQLPCPPGELPLADGSCLAPGVPTDGCGIGFTYDGDGACVPDLPAACGSGRMALPGEMACRAVGSCASGTWGNIPTDGSTQHVNGSFGGSSNGSATQPWTTIQAGVNAAANGAIVAIASGTYNESVVVDHPVRLWGVCPDQVTIDSNGTAAVSIDANADGTEVRSLSLTGAVFGVSATGAQNVVLSELWIHDTGDAGVSAGTTDGAGSLRIEASLLEALTQFGVTVGRSDLEVVDTVIRDVASNGNGNWGSGIDVVSSLITTKPTLAVRHSIIERTRTFGISVQGAVDGTIEDTLVRDVQPAAATGFDGLGVWTRWVTSDGSRPVMDVRGSLIERTYYTGIGVYGGELNIERTTVREVAQDQSIGGWGAGVRYFDVEPIAGTPPTGTMRQSMVDRGHRVGVELWGAEATLESIVVRDPLPKNNGEHGFGVLAYVRDDTGQKSTLNLLGSRIERANQGAIIVSGSAGTIDSTAILDTQPRQSDDAFGVAVSILTDYTTAETPTAEVTRTVVDGGHSAGIVNAGGELTVRDVIVRNILPQANINDFGDGIGASSTVILLPGVFPATMTVERVTVEGVPRAAVSNFGATVSVSSTLLECNQIDLDGENIDEASFTFSDSGDNDCGCGDTRETCKVLTTNIRPPLTL